MTLSKLLLGVTVMGLCMPTNLWAVDACDQDRPKFCGGVTPGAGRIHNCMMEKISELSPTCRKTVQKADDLYQSMNTVCRDDIQRFCAQHGPAGETRVILCLRDHHDELTSSCRKAFEVYKALDYRVRE
jgi:hypothetical protein